MEVVVTIGAIGHAKLQLNYNQGSCARRPKKLRLFKAFSLNNSRPIQGLLPVDHSVTYNPTGT